MFAMEQELMGMGPFLIDLRSGFGGALQCRSVIDLQARPKTAAGPTYPVIL
jgi:hypothetical protein